jgi:Xaa-Pro aminopeptidase
MHTVAHYDSSSFGTNPDPSSVSEIPSSVFRDRRSRLWGRLEPLGLRFLLISRPIDIYYLTGFRGSAGVLLLGPRQARLWVDPRYTLQAHEQSQGATVTETREPLSRAVAQWVRRHQPGVVGYQNEHLTCAELARLSREVRASKRHVAVRWRPVGFLLDELRVVKDSWEVERIRAAGKVTARVFRELLPQIQPGARESDLAAEIEYRMKHSGAQGAAFDTIVASGPRGAWPHARASSRRLRRGELVILDLGAILAGYAADMTRTVYLGAPTRRARELYEAVAEAQQETVRRLRAGMSGDEVDAVARRCLASRKLGDYFTHSTGHGVGLDVHERPRLGRGEQTLMPAGCVVTVEPGVYIEGYGGVRIEDTVLVGENGPEILTPASRESWYTG